MTDPVAILDSVLGMHRRTKSSEYAYMCPFCMHRKPKLAINILSGKWHCWVCDKAGRSIPALLRRLNVPQTTQHELRQALPTPQELIEPPAPPLALPEAWEPLWTATSWQAKRAQAYAASRGLTREDARRYNLGFCASGPYWNRLIIPSYDALGNLNYFTARDVSGKSTLKYLNPPVSKNVIGFEMYLNWNHPIVIVEGMLDAIITRWNATPLIGSTMTNALFYRILQEQVPVYIALDDDATKKIAKMARRLIDENITVYHVSLENHDPADMGFERMRAQMTQATQLTYRDSFHLSLQSL